MAIPVGGRRARLIKDAVYYTVKDSLEALGWNDPDRGHLPVTVIPEPLENDEEIRPNLIALDDDSTNSTEMELGSNWAEHPWDMVFDVYAENASVGLELSTDIRDILAGRFSSIGRNAPEIIVYDLSQDTPPELFRCELENISKDRVRSATRSYEKNWYVVFFTIIDAYADDLQDE